VFVNRTDDTLYKLPHYNLKEDDKMVSKTTTITNAEGLHMRPAGVVAKEMGKFVCDVTIVFGDKRINAKSLINIISACIKQGAEITFECDGEDEEAALAKIEELEAINFGE
jgi:phosphocarrier protein